MEKQHNRLGVDLGLLALRATVGGLLAGHGAQKLFGAFGGPGIENTSGWLESIGLKPGKPWALMAGASELGSGALMALGLLGPIGPISGYGPLVMSWATVHRGKPIWGTAGGAELPLTMLSAATTVALTGPGRFSLDRLLGIKVPASIVGLTVAGVGAGLAAGIVASNRQQEPESVASGEHIGVGEETLQSFEGTDAASEGQGGIGHDIDARDELQAREVGSDPPGSFGIDMRGADIDDLAE